jgi:hypothetical protein
MNIDLSGKVALDVDGGVLISNNIPYEEYFARAR